MFEYAFAQGISGANECCGVKKPAMPAVIKEGAVSKSVLIALVLIGLTALVLVFNVVGVLGKAKVDVNLLVTTVSMMKAIAFFIFTTIGVVIGMLLK